MAAIIVDDILKIITMIEKIFCVFMYDVNAFVS